MRKIMLFVLVFWCTISNAQYINESFEGNFPVSGWLQSTSEESTLTQVEDWYYQHPHSGNKFIKFSNNGLSSALLFSNSIPLNQGNKVAFSIWVKTNSANIKLLIGTSQNIECGENYQVILDKTYLSTGNYKQLKGYFIVPASGNYFFGVNIYDTIYNVYLDDFLVDVAPDCLPPSNLVVDKIFENTAILKWNDNNNVDASFLIEWLGGSNSNWQSLTSAIGVNQAEITGLEAGTYYQWRVSAICNTDTTTPTLGNGFYTRCTAVDQFSENFEGFSERYYPTCWSKIIEPLPTNLIWELEIRDHYLNGKVLNMEIASDGRFDGALALYAILPKIISIDNHILKFSVKYLEEDHSFEVGTLSDVYNSATYSAIQTIDKEGEFLISFNTNTTNQYIVFKMKRDYSDYNINIDDIVWKPTPDCIEPINLAYDSRTNTTVNISWEDTIDDSTAYTVDWRILGQSWQSITSDVGVTSYQITGLTPNTEYEWRISRNCNVGNSSFSYGKNFTTKSECPSVYSNSFRLKHKTINSLKLKWENIGNVTYLLKWKQSDSSTWNNITISNSNPNEQDEIEYNLTGLQPDTEYEFELNTICFDGSNSSISHRTYRTCNYIDNFDAPNFNWSLCWSKIIDNDDNDVYYSSSYLSFRYRNTTPPNYQYLYAISPFLTNLSSPNRRLRLLLTGGFEIFDIGTMSNTTDASTFTPIQSFDSQQFGNEEIVVDFNTTTNDNHLAIRVKSVNHLNDHLWIDRLIWEPIPSCFVPVNVTLDAITVDSANLSWGNNIDNNTVSYIIEWKQETSTVWQTATTAINTTNYQISGLTPNTKYQWRIKTNCNGDDSRYVNGDNFKTPCDVSYTEYSENFDTTPVGSYPNCWQYFNASLHLNGIYAEVKNIYPSNNNVLYSGIREVFLATPYISNLSLQNYRLKVKIKTNFLPVEVGVLNNLFEANSFTPYITTTSYEDYKEYIISFNQSETGHYIAFKGGDFFIDDFVWEPIPSCEDPNNLNLNFIGQTSAKVEWNAIQTTSYLIEWRSVCETTWHSATITTGEQSFIINNLNPNEEYKWRVSALCNNQIVNGNNFITKCPSISSFPYNESFEEYEIPNCWYKKEPNADAYLLEKYFKINITNFGYIENAIEFRINNLNSNISSALISQAFDITQLSNPLLEFYYKKDENSSDFSILVSTNDGLTYSTLEQNLLEQDDWVLVSYDLSDYISDKLVVKFVANHNNTNFSTEHINCYLDEFKISDNTLGISKYNNKKLFIFYPNPVDNILHLKSQKPIEEITIYNMLGQNVLSLMPKTNNFTINTNNLKVGVYTIQLRINNEISTVKLIKN